MLGINASKNGMRMILFVLLTLSLAPGLARAQDNKDKKSPPLPSKVAPQKQAPPKTSQAPQKGKESPQKPPEGQKPSVVKPPNPPRIKNAPPSIKPTFRKPTGATETPDGKGGKTFKTTTAEYHVSKDGNLTNFKTSKGTEAKFNSQGGLATVHTKDGMTIQHGQNGARRIESTRANGDKVISDGHGNGSVNHLFARDGHPYMQTTRVVNGHVYSAVYRGYPYHGVVYYGYVPTYYYAPAFYGWAYNPWVAPVSFAWGWGYGGWYGFYGPYFVASPFYAGPNSWLTDYIISQNLEAAYAAEVGAATFSAAGAITVPGNQAWTDTGKYLNAGDEVTMTAGGAVSMGGGWPNYQPAGSGKDPNCGGRGGFPAGDLPCWSLIGRVGDGPIFYVGNGTKIQAPNSGELLLGVNDNILGDNTGNWFATIVTPNNTPTGNPPTDDKNAALAPEVKQAIASEVKDQIATDNAAATTPPPSESGDQVPAALDPKHSVFIVSSTLSAQTDDGQCSLTGGDILTRITSTPDGNQNVRVLVTTAKQGDCSTGTQFAMSIQDLQDMYNDFHAKTDEGLKHLAQKQGQDGLPASPAPGGQSDPEAVAVKPDPTAAAAIKQQDQDANKAEADVDQAVQPAGGK
jgi:hypothetical protein